MSNRVRKHQLLKLFCFDICRLFIKGQSQLCRMEFSPNLSFSIKKKALWKQILVCRNDLSPQITHCWKVDVWFAGDALWHSTFGMRFLRPCREALLPRACCATGAAGSHSSRRQARSDRHAEKGKEMAGSGAPGCWHARPSVSQSAQRLSDWPH